MRFLALDFETSGLDPKRNAPVTLGVQLFVDGEPFGGACREWTVAPPRGKDGKVTREYDVVALKISGKTLAQIEQGMSAQDVCAELRQFARTYNAQFLPVVAFNAPFDFAFYSELLFMAGSWNQAERRYEGFPPPLAGPWQCARMLAAVKAPEIGKYSLDSVSAHFGLSRSSEKHGALEDSVLCGRVFCELTKP